MWEGCWSSGKKAVPRYIRAPGSPAIVAGITDATALRASERRQRSSYSTSSESVNKTAAARFALAAACAGFFLYMPIWSLLADGPFSWHVARPAAWQGGLEVVVLWMVI